MAVAVCSGDIVGVEGWKGVGDVGVDVGVGVDGLGSGVWNGLCRHPSS